MIFIIIDGLGDRPIKDLGEKTPLESAETPNMDYLAANGICGMQKMLPDGVYPTSEGCHLALFGYDYIKDYPGRGVLEAIGANIDIKKEDVVLRVDIGTVDQDLNLVDPHAGGDVETLKSVTDSLHGIEIEDVQFLIYPTLQHRAVLVLRGGGISAMISDTDPHKTHKEGSYQRYTRVLDSKPLDGSKEALFTSRVLKKYQKRTSEILKDHPFNKERVKEGKLPCNFILTRGAGYLKIVESFNQKYNLKSGAVAGAPLYKGIAKYLGMDLEEVEGATGTVNTNLDGKIKKTIELLDKGYNFVYLHIKATDSLAEDFGDFEGKKNFIEKIDKAMLPLLSLENTKIMVTGDHTTACEIKDHVEDPVPFFLYNGKDKDNTLKFGESFCQKGAAGYLRGTDFIKKILSY